MLASMSGGVSAQAFLLPLIVGISLLAFALTVVISLSPTEAEMREDAALMAHLSAPPLERPVGAHRPARLGSEPRRSQRRALVPAGSLACAVPWARGLGVPGLAWVRLGLARCERSHRPQQVNGRP